MAGGVPERQYITAGIVAVIRDLGSRGIVMIEVAEGPKRDYWLCAVLNRVAELDAKIDVRIMKRNVLRAKVSIDTL